MVEPWRTKKNRCLVTGASGYLGSRVAARLVAEGIPVLSMTRGKPRDGDGKIAGEAFVSDITAPFSFPSDVKVVYHCAGVISKNDDLIFRVNVDGTRHLVDAVQRAGALLVHVSSAGVVGDASAQEIVENTDCLPSNAYERSKYEAELLVRKAARSGLRCQIIRPTTIIGTGRDPSQDSFLHLLRAIQSGRYRQIGEGYHNLVHVEEVVSAMITLGSTNLPNGSVYLMNTPITFARIAEIVTLATTGSAGRTRKLPYPVALIAALLMTAAGNVTARHMPLTLSRLRALTCKRTFSQIKLERETVYRPQKDLEAWIADL